MKENLREDKLQVYEIGYLLVSSIPEDKVESEVSKLKEILSNKKADFICRNCREPIRVYRWFRWKILRNRIVEFDQI